MKTMTTYQPKQYTQGGPCSKLGMLSCQDLTDINVE
jgi:hypothetical protein